VAAAATVGVGLTAPAALAAPSSSFDASPRSPAVGERVRFTASDACDAPVVCLWRFGDGRGALGHSVSHSYDSPGTFTATLTTDAIGDGEDATSSSLDITVSGRNQRPRAVISPSSAGPARGQAVRFDSSGSSDPDGDPLTRAWDLDGDGRFDDGDGVTATRAFGPGTFTVRVRVTDPSGESDTASASVTVANGAPTASIRASETRPLSLTTVRFTAVASDPDGSIARRQWDLDGDGRFDDGGDQSVSHSYRIPGPKQVRLRVTDSDGTSATASLAIDVRNQPPRAAFTYSPQPVVRGRPVTFRSQSVDPEGRIDRLQWDFDGDGRFDDATGASPTRTFPASTDRIPVRLRVTDEDGGSATQSAVIVPGNLSPRLAITPSPGFPLTAEPVTFTADASDPDGAIASYAWSIDGTPATVAGPVLTTSFATSGAHVVALTVTDDAGASTTLEEPIEVTDRAPLVFTYAPNPVIRGVPVTFTAATADPSASFDALAWDLDGDGQFDDGTGTSATTVYPSATRVFVGLSGTDQDGKPVSVYREVSVQEPRGDSSTPLGPDGRPLRLMRPFPVVRFAGRLTARGARLQLLSVKAPRGATIQARCRGRGCPRKQMKVARRARVQRLKKLQTSYAAGARIVLRITKPAVIGKYVRITINKGKQPSRQDACAWPGVSKPLDCPG
jgi:hypothetical protein